MNKNVLKAFTETLVAEILRNFSGSDETGIDIEPSISITGKGAVVNFIPILEKRILNKLKKGPNGDVSTFKLLFVADPTYAELKKIKKFPFHRVVFIDDGSDQGVSRKLKKISTFTPWVRAVGLQTTKTASAKKIASFLDDLINDIADVDLSDWLYEVNDLKDEWFGETRRSSVRDREILELLKSVRDYGHDIR